MILDSAVRKFSLIGISLIVVVSCYFLSDLIEDKMMWLYRLSIFLVKGTREFTKQGYEAASKRFVPDDLDVDCSSKSYLVTGANSGLGYSCALEIAKRNGTVHMICRNEERGIKARQEIVEAAKNDKVYLHIVDMSELKRVAQFTKEFQAKYESLDVLINNAGTMTHERKKTAEGLDFNFAANTMGYYVITKGLLDTLKKSPKPRVINVSSGGMYLQKLDYSDFNFENMSKYDGQMVYAQNKRQQVIMAEQFAKQNKDIFFASAHPGWADTEGVRSSMADFYKRMEGKWRTPEQGADTILWLAIGKSAQELTKSGEFYGDRAAMSINLPLARTWTSDEENAVFMAKLDEVLSKLDIQV